ncbi:hypothetical protein QJ48_00380 [Paenibacillus sp. A3]|uniref:hypothetical protein n=1 Tax=Paenibacillus sp. A3 TaxID=1337054 RepID=UPI0006D59E21|nr:hypothetical protein [Paenibacillus sp. A3]KPV61277.1 hypothetical protein QJ48_00380 [Paenibacillus sp. A3]
MKSKRHLKYIYHDAVITALQLLDDRTVCFHINLSTLFYKETKNKVILELHQILNFEDFLEYLSIRESNSFQLEYTQRLEKFLRIDGIMLATNTINGYLVITIDIDHLGAFGLFLKTLHEEGDAETNEEYGF